jgi:hypothetical protein
LGGSRLNSNVPPSANSKRSKYRKDLEEQYKERREPNPGWNRKSRADKKSAIEEDRKLIERDVTEYIDDNVDFNFVKIHLARHFGETIKELGHLSNLSTDLPETLMRPSKDAYKQSNRVDAVDQILQWTARTNFFAYSELEARAIRLKDASLVLPKGFERRLKYKYKDVKTLDDVAAWSDTPSEHFHHLLAWCFKTYLNDDRFCATDEGFDCLKALYLFFLKNTLPRKSDFWLRVTGSRGTIHDTHTSC